MANQNKVKPGALFSDKVLSVDSNGRIRIGGKFASAKQVGAWRGARKRRGLSTYLPKSPSQDKRQRPSTKRSNASRKGALTKKLGGFGVDPPDRFRTPGANYLKADYDIPEVDAEIINLILQREIIGRKAILLNLTAVGFDKDGNEEAVGTPFRIVNETNTEKISNEEADRLSALLMRYQFAETETITVTVSVGHTRKD